MENKVLFTASTFSHIRNFHLPYIRWFHEQGWEVHVACGGKLEHIEFADRTMEIPFKKQMTSLDNLRAVSILRNLIHEENYALISTHTTLAAFFTRLAVKGMRNRPKVLNIVHGYLFDDATPKAKRVLLQSAERITAGETDLLLTMNKWDYDFATTHNLAAQVENIPGMGVDFTKYDHTTPADGKALRHEYNIPDDAFVLIYPAEFSERKSQHVLIEAMTNLPDNVYLFLPGDGALLEKCRDQAAKLELTHRIIFPGRIRDMAPWYVASDVAVTASRSEGLPFNVMEAMHFGLPVVASSVKGHTDLIEDGKTGILYPYNDSTACAEAIRRIIDSPSLRQTYGNETRIQSEQYSLATVFLTVLSFYSSLLPAAQIPQPVT